MGVVTWEYYSNTWMGEAPETAFPRLDLLAEDMIANITRQADYSTLTANQQTLWQKAVCVCCFRWKNFPLSVDEKARD